MAKEDDKDHDDHDDDHRSATRGRSLGASTTSGKNEYSRPRRPNPDTLQYLKSLPLDLQVSNKEVTDFLLGVDDGDGTNSPREFPQILAAALSAVDEIRHEVASLAGDERAAEILELLARIACPYSETAGRILLASAVPYAVHLATHRYGSHVLQTLLQLAVTKSPESATTYHDLALHKDSPISSSRYTTEASLPSLVSLVVSVQEELTPFLDEMSIHLCGSHVVRTLLCVLGRVQMTASAISIMESSSQGHRGKKKKKKQKHRKMGIDNTTTTSSYAPSCLEMTWDIHSRLFLSSEPSILQSALEELTKRLSGTETLPPGDLQHVACHPSAGPLMMVLLRILTYQEASAATMTTATTKDEGSFSVSNNRSLGKHRVEPKFQPDSEAHKLAKRLLCWKDEETGEEEAKRQQPWAGDVIYEYAGKSSGSRVLEAILRLSFREFYESILRAGHFFSSKSLQEYAQHDVGNFIVQTALVTLHTRYQADELLQAVSPIIRSGLVVDPARKRRGILWRAVEAAATHKVRQKEIKEDLIHGFESLQQSEKKTVHSLKDCVALLLDMKLPEINEGRLGLDVPGARSVHSLLRFEPELCKDTLKGVLRLSSQELEALARDGLGSRCVWDGILEGPTAQDASFATASKQLVSKLQGRWVALASDRVGQHSVRKIFSSVTDMSVRKVLVVELAQGKSRLDGTAMGRSVMEACLVHEYKTRGEKEWEVLVNKRLQKAHFLREIVEETSAPRGEATKRLEECNKKRKEDANHSDSKKKRKKDSRVTVDSIMTTLTIPSERGKS